MRVQKQKKDKEYATSKLTKKEVSKIVKLYRNKVPIKKIAEQFYVSYPAVYAIVKGLSWSWFTGIEK